MPSVEIITGNFELSGTKIHSEQDNVLHPVVLIEKGWIEDEENEDFPPAHSSIS